MSPPVRRGVRSEESTISLSDPIVTLTLITVVLWLAVIGWKLQRREQANGAGRGGKRRGAPRDDYGYEDDYAGYGYEQFDDRAQGGYDDWPRRALRPVEEAPPPRKPPARSPSKAGRVKAEVEVNPGKCARFAFCEHEAPGIFKLNGDRLDYKTTVPADQIDAVAMAVKVCPARAIKMKVPGSKPYLPQPDVDDTERRPVRR
jgi:ferredoxin